MGDHEIIEVTVRPPDAEPYSVALSGDKASVNRAIDAIKSTGATVGIVTDPARAVMSREAYRQRLVDQFVG